jgi:para-aminobenzoate synthetase
VYHRHVVVAVDAAAVYADLFADSTAGFWLDGEFRPGGSRYSYMGDATGPNAERIGYDVVSGTVTAVKQGIPQIHRESIFEYLSRALAARRTRAVGLPFPFHGGYVGYLGYESKADCGAAALHRAATPDAAFIFADRFVAFDHTCNAVYLVCVDDEGQSARAEQWIQECATRLAALTPRPSGSAVAPLSGIPRTPRHDRARYLEMIAACKREIRRGESYEVCLTNMFEYAAGVEPLRTWLALRRHNPAPHGALFFVPGVAVASSSPERFLRVDVDGGVRAQPIKGTRRRSRDPAEDEALRADLAASTKDRAENLMIVDLLRNDLGRVCKIGSVEAADLFAVETFATVHQLVSTVTGRLASGCDAVQAVRAAFPPGSMTGAPKLRTMEIIDRLEGGARGPYAGVLGYFSVNGAADLGVVIRAIVVAGDRVTVGAGGAVVELSNPEAELDEMLLKAAATEPALLETAAVPRSAAVSP